MMHVLIIIVSYRTSHLIPRLLASVEEPQVPVRIALLDNASTEATYRPLLELNDDRVHLFRATENLGFTGGINHVLRSELVTKGNFTHFFLLNPDAFCKPGLIGQLGSLLSSHPGAACISPRITDMEGRPWYEGGTIQYHKGKITAHKSTGAVNGRGVQETDVFNGCAALFDLKKVQEAGLFNEGLFMYYDEAEMSIKLKSLGYTILYAPQFSVLHDVSYTTRHISHLKTYYMTRNKFLVFNNTMSRAQKLYFLAHELAFHCKNRRLKNVVYHIRGYLDFARGKVGAFK